MDSITVFDSLLVKDHVTHALVQDEEQYNEVPMRAYMDYFSTQHAHLKGNHRALVESQFCGFTPLVCGLFSGFGQAMITLGDAMEARNSIMVVQSFVLSSVGYSALISDILTDKRFERPSTTASSPSIILSRAAHDGRFSLNRSGPGFRHAHVILSSPPAREAIADYVHQLDLSNVARLLDNMSRLSVLMLCGTHKKGSPAFDLYLSRTVSLVNSLRVLIHECPSQQLDLLIRGTWFLLVLSYITQLRPRLDESLIWSFSTKIGKASWEDLLRPLHLNADALQGKHHDPHFLRALRSLRALSLSGKTDDPLYLHAAQKLDSEWQGWTGLGKAQEASLNIRL
ncbi:hypothetical protein M406DRAFT_341195 [Cryphonectria parasitica EP155]|uniref:Uncharacterized protein n=1 Tax=Cryphonectria parasitica (strain ATCC 38755 / EP155) TaxID=660469 RepID=A0A9P5CMZ5_CRYP1|nr:uncharacterized protein M406DRAFT_341195 [Cryphonectria parasitica EP155]KAF3763772.1 hypothetical protein M406DRAFT_341195 [Cryphonectria parasitica EP155]